jgi:AraC-like DNA-binding protein
MNDGGFASIVFAATRPERTRALILADSYSFYGFTEGWDDVECDPAELWARHLPEQGEDYMPSVEQITRMQEIGRAVRSGWGSGATFSISAPSASGRLPYLDSDLGAPALAGLAGTSTRQLSRLFRTHLGTTPNKYVRAVRTASAAKLLSDTQLPLTAIARRCGFTSTETLRQAFLIHYDTIPSIYRRAHQRTR